MELDADYNFREPAQNVCRVCLAAETKLYHLVGCGLQIDFLNITGIRISLDDGLPQHICYVCHKLLKNANAFKNKCISTHNMMNLQHVTTECDRSIVTTPLISFIQTETLLLSYPPVAPTYNIDTNLINTSLVKKEYDPIPEHKDDVYFSEAFVKVEIEEQTFDDGTDFDMDVDVTNNMYNEPGEQEENFDMKPNPKARGKRGKYNKFPNVKKVDPEMDNQAVKNYLLRLNPKNVYAEMLYTHLISKYIDKTKVFDNNIYEVKDDFDSEDESVPLNKLIKVEDDSVEVDNILNLQTDVEPTKYKLYLFVKRKYIGETIKPEKKKPKATDLVRIKFKTDKRVVQSQMALEELRTKCNMEVRILSLKEQIAEVQNRAKSEAYENSRYQCEECFRGFQFERTYNYHMRSHNPELSGNFKCEVCNKLFMTRRKMRKHQLDHKYRFRCKDCGRVTKSVHDAKEHAKCHSGQNAYKCEYCYRVFSKSASRTNHVRIKHGSVQCEICYELLSPAGLTMHNVLRHKETFECPSCDKSFNDADALDVHITHSTDGICNADERPCAKCGESFASESLWMEHVQEHRTTMKRLSRAKYYPSNRSDMPDAQPAAQRPRTSKDGAAEPERAVMCDMCGDRFLSSAAMRYHQRIHTGEKPYACTYCPKRFRLNTLLQMHIRTHTGERPHKCKMCPKSFKCATALYRHRLVHTKERRHRCTYCEKTFQTSTSVKLHIKTVHLKIPMPPRVRNRKKRAE